MPTELRMPQLGESIHEGTISRWLKQPGERVERYEPIVEVATDKVTSEVTAPASGVLGEFLVSEGQTVKVGTVLALIEAAAATPTRPAPPAGTLPTTPRVSPLAARVAADQGIDVASLAGSGPGGQVTRADVLQAVQARASAATEMDAGPMALGSPASLASFLSPRVQALAARLGVDLSQVRGTGRDGRITARDVERHAQAVAGEWSAPPLPAPAAPPAAAPTSVEALPGDDLIPLSLMRRTIAKNMTHSQRTAPHVTTVHEADVTRMVQFFNAEQEAFRQREGFPLTYTPFFLLAVVNALRAFPQVNVVFTEQGIIQRRAINIGVAVALADGGLLVPVLTGADEKTLVRLARDVVDMATRARANRLTPDETRGGTFTVTNYGMFGGLIATPVLNPPQAAILGVGAVHKRPIVVEMEVGDSIAIRSMVYLSLTFDHRAFDGALADQFMQRVVDELQGGGWRL